MRVRHDKTYKFNPTTFRLSHVRGSKENRSVFIGQLEADGSVRILTNRGFGKSVGFGLKADAEKAAFLHGLLPVPR